MSAQEARRGPGWWMDPEGTWKSPREWPENTPPLPGWVRLDDDRWVPPEEAPEPLTDIAPPPVPGLRAVPDLEAAKESEPDEAESPIGLQFQTGTPDVAPPVELTPKGRVATSEPDSDGVSLGFAPASQSARVPVDPRYDGFVDRLSDPKFRLIAGAASVGLVLLLVILVLLAA